MTASTSGVSGSIVITTVLCRATSAGDGAALAPALTTSSTGPRLRLWTINEWPLAIRFFAIGFPMTPSPMKPTVSDIEVLSALAGVQYNFIRSIASPRSACGALGADTSEVHHETRIHPGSLDDSGWLRDVTSRGRSQRNDQRRVRRSENGRSLHGRLHHGQRSRNDGPPGGARLEG